VWLALRVPVTVEAREAIETRVGQMVVAKAGRAAPALLVITPMVEWMTRALPAELCDLYTLNLLELPGPGNDTHPDGAASVDAIGAAVGDVTRRLDRTTVLFGHSMNGALALAAASTADCSGVIAVTPPSALPPDPGHSAAYWEERAEPERRRRAREIVATHEATSDEHERARLQDEFTRLRRWYRMDINPTELDALAILNETWISSVFESGKTVDWPNTFRRLQQPVLLALGDYDFVAPPVAWSADIIPSAATVHHFKKSSHTPYIEEPEEFIQVAAAWTKTHIT
jgi:pimeloyl-ACP methyl ester carboxylesterase